MTRPSDQTTLDAPGTRASRRTQQRLPALTIMWHPDVARVGERVRFALARPQPISRNEPVFSSTDLRRGGPLGDPYISRNTARIEQAADDHLRVVVTGTTRVEVDGEVVDADLLLNPEWWRDGVLIVLAQRVVLLLHDAGPPPDGGDDLGLVGASDAMAQLRHELRRVAPLEVPVLLRGESGTGKELISSALHQHSKRAAGPFVAVNMATLTQGTAASELFGHARGAFTGAVRSGTGLFERADGGTLLLDEIGVAAPDVQAMLLRTLESGEITPVGGAARRVDVRIVAATDARLDDMMKDGTFSLPLYHRLAGYRLDVPALRRRPDDIARLLVHFLTEELTTLGSAWRLKLSEPRAQPWLDAPTAYRLLAHDWPGNVRELRNVARQIAVVAYDQAEAILPPAVESTLTVRVPRAETVPEPPDSRSTTPPVPRVRPSQVTDEQLVAALEEHGWAIRATARALGVSKTSLYRLIDRCAAIRRAADVSDEELLAAHGRHGDDTRAIASELRVSEAGVRARLADLTG